MPIAVTYEPRHLQLVLSMLPKALFSGKRLSQAVDQLFEALRVIRERMGDRNIYYFALDFGNRHRKGEEFSPWTDDALAMWGRVALAPHLHARLKKWLTELEQLLIDANQSGRSTASLWELDEFQLGEAAASTFAFVDLHFVPYYTRLLKVWDMDHEVRQFDTINEIITRHGICTETEELLLVRAENAMGQMGHDQFIELKPLLEAHYGDFSKTPYHRLLGWD